MNNMSREEACKLLKLPVKDNYTTEEIDKTFRDAIKKNHPDHGGSNEISAKLNEARNFLRTYFTFNDNVKDNNKTYKAYTSSQNENQKHDRAYYEQEYRKKIDEYFKNYVVSDSYNELDSMFVDVVNSLKNDSVHLSEDDLRRTFISNKLLKLLYAEIRKYVFNFCGEKNVSYFSFQSYFDDPIYLFLPINTNTVIKSIKQSYKNYQKDYFRKLVHNRTDYNALIDSFDYDSLYQMDYAETIFNEKVKEYENERKKERKLDNLRIKLNTNISSIKFLLRNVRKNVNNVSNELEEIKNNFNVLNVKIQKLLNENIDDVDTYVLAAQESDELLSRLTKLVDEITKNNNKQDSHTSKLLENTLNIEVDKIKIPLVFNEYVRIKKDIDNQVITSVDKILKEFNNIKYMFCDYYGLDQSVLLEYKIEENLGYESGTKYDSYGFRISTTITDEKFDFNKLDSRLSALYKKYVLTYVKGIISSDMYKNVDQDVKHELAQKIFREDLYSLKISDIDNLLNIYLDVNNKIK